ncbi:MAG: ABC transporter ATP-binding protein [bacterium]|nr:ABC transporter ATP-binding protein [bacterium]
MLEERSDQPALLVSDLRSGYRGADVLHDVQLSVPEGAIYAVLGKNGMGKTTLLKTIMGLLPARRGSVTLFGLDVTAWPAYRIARHGVSYVPQEQAIFQDLNVEENLRLALGTSAAFGERLDEVAGLFPFLKQRLNQTAGTLSGGEQKMLLVARALITAPRLILIDEISEGLQPAVVDQVRRVLLEVRQRGEATILLIEQNVSFAFSLADSYAILKLGEIVEGGVTAHDDAVQAVSRYLAI